MLSENKFYLLTYLPTSIIAEITYDSIGTFVSTIAINSTTVTNLHRCILYRTLKSGYTLYCTVSVIVLYCIVLYCIVLYCIVLYCIVLYCIVL